MSNSNHKFFFCLAIFLASDGDLRSPYGRHSADSIDWWACSKRSLLAALDAHWAGMARRWLGSVRLFLGMTDFQSRCLIGSVKTVGECCEC